MAYLRYRGIDLPIPPPELEEWVRDHLDPCDLFPQFDLSANASAAQRLPVQPTLFTFPKTIRLNTLRWPAWGASRFATFHTVVDEATRAAIYAAFNDQPANLGTVSGTLEMCAEDGPADLATNAISVSSMYVADLRPLTGYDDTLYLLTLADQRYFFNRRAYRASSVTGSSIYLPVAGVGTATQRWKSIIDEAYLGPFLGAEFTTSLAAIYGVSYAGTATTPATNTPNPGRWTANPGVRACSPQLVADGAALAIGRRLVHRTSTTTPLAQTWQEAKTANDANFANAAFNARRVAGGRMTQAQLLKHVPREVQVRFDDQIGEGGWGPFGTIGNFARVRQLASLGITEWGTVTNHSSQTNDITGYKAAVQAELMPVFSGSTITNDADLDTYATQAATDYYGWYLADADATWAGIVPLEVNGFQDYIEWCYRGEQSYTRQTRAVMRSTGNASTITRSHLPTLRTRYWGTTEAYRETSSVVSSQSFNLTPVELPRGFWRISVSGWTSFYNGFYHSTISSSPITGTPEVGIDFARVLLRFNRQISTAGDLDIGTVHFWGQQITVGPDTYQMRSGGPFYQSWSYVGAISVAEDNFQLVPTVIFNFPVTNAWDQTLQVGHITLTALRVDWGYLQATYGVWGAAWGGGGAGGGGGKNIENPLMAMMNEEAFIVDDVAIVAGQAESRELLRRRRAIDDIIP